jgi:hypothetical protein
MSQLERVSTGLTTSQISLISYTMFSRCFNSGSAFFSAKLECVRSKMLLIAVRLVVATRAALDGRSLKKNQFENCLNKCNFSDLHRSQYLS